MIRTLPVILRRKQSFGAWYSAIKADGGTIENPAYIQAEIDKVPNASFAMFPGAYKSGVLYVPIPDDLSANFMVDRASPVNTIGTNGLLRTLGVDFPAIDNTGGEPKLLLQPLAINLYFNNAVLETQDVSTTTEAHTVSFFGTGTVTFSGTYVGSLVGTGVNDRVELTFTPTAGTLTSTVTGSCTNAQIESYIYATTPVTTTGSTATRLQDTIKDGGSLAAFAHTDAIFQLKGIFRNGTIVLSDGSSNNRIQLIQTSSTSMIIRQQGGGTAAFTSTSIFTNLNVETKITLISQASGFSVYENENPTPLDSGSRAIMTGLDEIRFQNLSNGDNAFGTNMTAKFWNTIAKAKLDETWIP